MFYILQDGSLSICIYVHMDVKSEYIPYIANILPTSGWLCIHMYTYMAVSKN